MVSHAPQAATPVAAIDIGTNSFHLVVARPTGNNRFEILGREKEVVRLGSGSGDMKELHPDAIERGVAALGRFRRIADTFGAEVHAVATSAVREAENREEFLEAALRKAGVRVEVISGVEEARLIHLGRAPGGAGLRPAGARGRHRRGQHRVRRRPGRRAARRPEPQGRRHPPHRALLRQGAGQEEGRRRGPQVRPKRTCPGSSAWWSDAGGFEVAVGSSGTILNVAEMVRAHYGSETAAPGRR